MRDLWLYVALTECGGYRVTASVYSGVSVSRPENSVYYTYTDQQRVGDVERDITLPKVFQISSSAHWSCGSKGVQGGILSASGDCTGIVFGHRGKDGCVTVYIDGQVETVSEIRVLIGI